jgi:hypothetical protein
MMGLQLSRAIEAPPALAPAADSSAASMDLSSTIEGAKAALEGLKPVTEAGVRATADGVRAAAEVAGPKLVEAGKAAPEVVKGALVEAGKSAPEVVKGAGTVAGGLFQVGKTTFDVLAPVVVEGGKVAAPIAQRGLEIAGEAITDAVRDPDGFSRGISDAASGLPDQLSSAASSISEGKPVIDYESVNAFGTSPLGAALGTAAPYAAGAIVGFFVLQVAVEKLREAVQPLVAPAIVFGALGTALYVSAQLNAIRLPDPSVVFFPVGAASAAFVAYSLLSAPTNAPQQESEEEDATAGVVPMEPMGAVVVDTAKEGNADESDDTATEV